MKKILYSILLAGMCFVGCTDFDDPVVEKYGDGPSVSIEVTATSDSAFTFTITPAKGTQYYSFVVAKGNAPQRLNAASLLKGNYSGLTGSVLKAADAASYTCDMYAKDAPLCEPNTTYQIYAVAASDKGITGEIATASATTTDEGIPTPKAFKDDAANKAVVVTFSEPVVRGEGAISAKYYKEWDLANPVVLEEDDFTVSIKENVVTFAAPETPAGAFVAYSWEAGAFKDSYGNDCPAVNSGLNTNTGKLVNACVRNALKAFVIADSNITAPVAESVFPKWEEFEGEITMDFDLYRNEKKVKAGAISIVYSGEILSSVIKLTAEQWHVSGNKVTFSLPSAPMPGDIVKIEISEGAFTDIYGNPNAAYTSEDVWWKFFAMTKEMVLGTFDFSYVSASNGKVYNSGTVTIEEDPEEENGVIIYDLFLEGSKLSGRYDTSVGKFYVGSFYILGYAELQGTTYGLITYPLTETDDEIEFTVNADGTIVSTNFGVVAMDENLESPIGWWIKASTATLSPATETTPAKSTPTNKSRKIAKINAQNLSYIRK